MANNSEIEAGAKAIAEDLKLPGGSRKKLARVVGGHLDWFDAAEARGLTWGDISRLLFAAGAKGNDDRRFSVGTLSSAVWRKREEAKTLARPLRAPIKAQVAQQQHALRGRSGDRNAASGEPAGSAKVADKGSKALARRRHLSETSHNGQQETTKPKSESRVPPETEATSNAQTLAFMKRAATIRRARTD